GSLDLPSADTPGIRGIALPHCVNPLPSRLVKRPPGVRSLAPDACSVLNRVGPVLFEKRKSWPSVPDDAPFQVTKCKDHEAVAVPNFLNGNQPHLTGAVADEERFVRYAELKNAAMRTGKLAAPQERHLAVKRVMSAKEKKNDHPDCRRKNRHRNAEAGVVPKTDFDVAAGGFDDDD